MKLLRSLPTDKGFFDVYALLIQVIRKSKTAAQIVSGLTEIGIIYTIAYQSIQPILPGYVIYVSAIIAVIFTMVVEGGLRVLTPLSVDAVLYKRVSGLHLPMTIAIFVITLVLLAASGILSFQNSGEIVAAVTPEAEEQNTIAVDSTFQAESAAFAATFSVDSTMIVEGYEKRIAAEETAFNAKISATQTRLRSYSSREARTGESYATAKDRQREKMDELEAKKKEVIAQLEAARSKELNEARSEYKSAVGISLKERKAKALAIKQSNENAEIEREAKVNSYGGKLGYFTLVCLFLFVAANILDRIHAKGSGIREIIDVSQYDISPHWTTNALQAFMDRINYYLQSRIKAFADATPPAPLPEQKAELYDPTQGANVTITLKIGKENDTGENVVYIEPKRRKIGFQQGNRVLVNQTAINHPESVQAQQKMCAIKDTAKESFESLNLRQLKQRLKMYKKRLGSHEQKKLTAERKGECVSKKTLNAIDNNKNWVAHYEQLIKKATKEE